MTLESKDMEINLNGESTAISTDATLLDVLRTLEIDPSTAKGVAVAVNEEVVRRQLWAERRLQSGDSVEIVTARQGG